MLPRTYESQHCSIARTLEVVGDRWTLLVIREAFLGVRRFDGFQESLGLARTVLSDRLNRLCEEGIFARVRYQERPERFEYRLTEKGLDLWPVLVGLLKWGDKHCIEAPPVVLRHRSCGGELDDRRICHDCGEHVDVRHTRADPGPGALAPVPA